MKRDVLTKKIEKNQEKITDDVRNYIGASTIGSDCFRQIWYEYKGFKGEKIPAKTRRTWAIGKRLEWLVLDWLEDCGIKFERIVKEFSSKRVPFFKGNVDSASFKNGKIHYVLEIKTAKDASFKVFVKNGLRLWQPRYYAQIQSYMGMSGANSASILVLNKDNSDLSDELVHFDEEYYKKLESKALMVSQFEKEPERINKSPLWYQCRMCKFNKVCHK